MNFDNDEDIMKAINAGGGTDMNVDDELEALEAEINGGQKKEKKKKKEGDELSLSDLSEEKEEKKEPQKHEKKASDDDLDALEKEGLDDINDDEEEEKPKPKPELKSQPQPKAQPKPQEQPKKMNPPPQPQKKPEPQINKQELKEAMKEKLTKKSSSDVDLYPERVENKYHNVQKMNSLGVLEKEKEICDKIIQFKKTKDEDSDTWEFKKQSIDDKISIITSTIENGACDFETYKKKIKEQYSWETKLLIFVDKDQSLKPEQKNIIKERVNNRKKIIEEELTKNPEEEAAEEEEQAPPQKEEKKPEPEIQKQASSTKPTTQTTTGDKGKDYYPENVEKKYHNITKMDSLGVLEKEKDICNLIIEYKKKKGNDYDEWEIKKDLIDTKKETLTTSIENGIIDFEGYKKKIKVEYEWESKLLLFLEQDKNINDSQKKIIKERINKRKKLIEEELLANPDEQEDEKEPEKEEKKQEIKKEEKVENTKSTKPITKEQKGEDTKEIKRLEEIVVSRLNEYRAAINYFKNNELAEQQANAIKFAKEIDLELKKIHNGKWREVDEFNLPDPITPEFIYGYSKEEREKKFKKIIFELNKQKEGVEKTINSQKEAFNKLPKTQYKKIEAMAQKGLDALNQKKEKYSKIIYMLNERLQDKWVPAPLFIESQEESKVEKMNSDIPEYTVRIIFGKTTYSKKEKLYLVVSIPGKEIEPKKFNQKNPGDWTEQVDFTVEKGDFRNIFRSKFHVEIYEKKKILKDRFRGQFDMEPRGLKDHIEFSDTYKIDLESKREGVTATVAFKVRKPCKDPEYTTETKSIFHVTRIYPSFDIKGGNSADTGIKIEVSQKKLNPDDLKISTNVIPKQVVPKQAAPKQSAPKPAQKASKPSAQPSAAKPKQGAKKQGPPKAHIDKSEFKEEELKDPDCLDCLQTLQVLEFKINKYEEIRNKIDGRTPRELMQRIIRMKCKKQSLTDALGEDISPQDYLTLLRTTFAHDKKLADYFNQNKDSEKSKLVSERLPLIIKETEELMKQMPK